MRLPLSKLRVGAREKWIEGRSVVSDGARMMGINWVEAAFSALYLAVMARAIGPELYGHWAYGIASYTLLMGLLGSFDMLMLLRLGQDRRDADRFVGLTLILRIGLLAVGACGLAVYALAIETDRLNTVVMLLLIPALFGRGIALWARICFLGYERIAEYARFAALFRIGEAGFAIAYLATGGGLLGVVILHSLSWLLEAGFGVLRIRQRLTSYSLHVEPSAAVRLLAQGTILGLATSGYACLAVGPIMMLRYSDVPIGQVGQFAIVLSLTIMLVGSAESFASSALPRLSRSLQGIETGQGTGRSYSRIAALAIGGAALGAAAICWIAGPAITGWVLGQQYALAGALLTPLALIGGAILLPIGYFQTLLARGQKWPEAIGNLAAALFLAVALLPTAAKWGIGGAVGATAAAWTLRAAILIGWGEFENARGRMSRLTTALG